MDSSDYDNLRRATDVFSEIVRSLSGEDLQRQSACGDWSNRDVVNHVCGGALRYAHYMRGGLPGDIVWTRTADNIGADPLGTHQRLSADLWSLFDQPGAGEVSAHHPMQVVSGETLLRMRVAELALHAWDVASSLDPDAAVDDQLARYLLDRSAEILETQRRHGYFLSIEVTEPDATASTRLLAFTGRTPGWSCRQG